MTNACIEIISWNWVWICSCPEQRQTFTYLNKVGIELSIAGSNFIHFETAFKWNNLKPNAIHVDQYHIVQYWEENHLPHCQVHSGKPGQAQNPGFCRSGGTHFDKMDNSIGLLMWSSQNFLSASIVVMRWRRSRCCWASSELALVYAKTFPS